MAVKEQVILQDQTLPVVNGYRMESRRKVHYWPNLEGNVDSDSLLTYNRRLNKWTIAWVYTKEKCQTLGGDNQGILAGNHTRVSDYTGNSQGVYTIS